MSNATQDFSSFKQFEPSREQWQAVYDQSPIGIAFIGPHGEWLRVNQKVCSLLEYTAGELFDRTFQDVTHPDDIKPDMEMLTRLEQGEIPGYEMLKRYITKSNKIVWIRLTVWPIRDEDGKIIHYVSHIQPLLNGEKTKMEKFNNNVEIRPTLSIGDFISDNWKSFITAGVFIIATSVTIGTAFWTMTNKISTLERIVIERQFDEINERKQSIEPTKRRDSQDVQQED